MRKAAALRGTGIAIAIVLLVLAAAMGVSRRPRQVGGSCATFVLNSGKTLLVGHNLDESMRVPGLIVVNPRGLAKENRTFDDIKSGKLSASAPRIQWTSKYGSITYNVFGRELPDGGLNEAGLYVGEMTLLATVWPEDVAAARFYHNLWIQYLLDNFASVDDAVSSLRNALPEGHCKWHFLLADRTGKVAVVEFLAGKPVVYQGGSLPYPILCNDPYDAELKDIVNYQGFGGSKKPEPRYEREDPRFRWAAVMLADRTQPAPAAERAFAILSRMDLGTTKWSVVYDLQNARLYFHTTVAPKARWVDFSSFDFSCATGPQGLDIDLNAEGDVSRSFTSLSEDMHKKAVANAWAEIDAGTMGNMFFKPPMIKGLGAMPGAFHCATPGGVEPRK